MDHSSMMSTFLYVVHSVFAPAFGKLDIPWFVKELYLICRKCFVDGYRICVSKGKDKRNSIKKRRYLIYDLDKKKIYYQHSNNDYMERCFKNAPDNSLYNYMAYVIRTKRDEAIKSPEDWISWEDNNDDYYIH